MIRFLAEITTRFDGEIQPTPSNDISRTLAHAPIAERLFPTGVYEIDVSRPTSSYWLDWEGGFDNYDSAFIDVYYGQFLCHVNLLEKMFAMPFSLYIDVPGHEVYFNIPISPWLYADHQTDVDKPIPFISSALNADNPSRNKLQGVNAQTRLTIPDFTVKLSDSISGVMLNQKFNLDFDNNDGYFDDDNTWDLFNTPVRIKKAVVENPAYEDFREIRYGLAEGVRATFDKFTIGAADKLRNMNEPVCRVIRGEDFPGVTLLSEAEGKNIPVVYGKKRVDLIKISDNPENHLACEYFGMCLIYDNDDDRLNIIPNFGSGLIAHAGAKYAVVSGHLNNRIGEIIVDLITRKTAIPYNDSNWNIDEVDAYISESPRINIAFTSGDVNKAIQEVLKSDMAYFIQQSDGRFTIRKYGNVYGTHRIPAWAITKKPEKDFSKAQTNYFSSCVINYNRATKSDKDSYDTLLFDEMEKSAEDKYRKTARSVFETDLSSRGYAMSLARTLGGRYATMRQSLKIPVGIDTSGIELLDTVYIDMTINGRGFSTAKSFIVTEINPAQDILTLEEISGE